MSHSKIYCSLQQSRPLDYHIPEEIRDCRQKILRQVHVHRAQARDTSCDAPGGRSTQRPNRDVPEGRSGLGQTQHVCGRLHIPTAKGRQICGHQEALLHRETCGLSSHLGQDNHK